MKKGQLKKLKILQEVTLVNVLKAASIINNHINSSQLIDVNLVSKAEGTVINV